MTKSELIEGLKDLDDDAEVHVYCWENPCGHVDKYSEVREEVRKDEIKNRISMALKDPILQQGFEIICRENNELESQVEQLQKINSEQKEMLKKVRIALIQERTANLMNYGKGGVEIFDSILRRVKEND